MTTNTLSTVTTTCFICDESIYDGQPSYQFHNSTNVACHNCFEHHAVVQCSDCMNYFLNSKTTYIVNLNQYYCADCASRHNNFCLCVDCGDWYTSNQMCWADDDLICVNCCQVTHECSHCHRHISRLNLTNETGDYLCNRCYDNMDGELTFLQSNKETGQPDTKKTFFGVEVELYYNDERYINRYIRNRFIECMKLDGSLADGGIEINFNPFTKEFFKENKETYKKIFDEFACNGGTCDYTGIHIHVSKKPLSRIDQYKIFRIGSFITRSFCHKNFNRSESQYNEYSGNYTLKNITRVIYDNGNTSHCQKISLSRHNTIEFRFFGTTFNFNEFQGYFEFIQAILDYVPNHSIRECSLKRVRAFIRDNRNKYPHIFTILDNNGYIDYPVQISKIEKVA